MMLTRCPGCETTFRITPEQLKARGGQVRCGNCRHVFDALATLVEEVSAPPAEPAGAANEAGPEAPHAERPPEAPAMAAEVAEPPPIPAAAPEGDGASAPRAHPLANLTAEDAPPTLEPLLHDVDVAPARRWPWALGVILGLAALALQAAVAFRVEIATWHPEAKPVLAALCDVAGCDLPLPQKIDLVGIETSDLHPDAGNSSRLLLTAVLKNRAGFAQAYPHLELTLTDTGDRPLVRKVVPPVDYLPADRSVAAGFPSGADLALSLAFDSKEPGAAGYRLYLFYP